MPALATAEEFLSVFNKIEDHLSHLQNTTEHVGFRRLVEQASKTNGIVNFYKHDLIEYLELRNALVHKSTGQAIAEPHREIIDELNYIHRQLTKPLTALEIARRPVYTTTVHEVLSTVLQHMTHHFYISVPVYVDTQFVGVLSHQTVVKWLGKQAEKGQVSLHNTTVGQLQEYFERPDNKYNAYLFVSQDTDAFSVRESFLSFTSEEKRLGAVFVTEQGKSGEQILGIITAWDLPRVTQLSHAMSVTHHSILSDSVTKQNFRP